MPSNGMTGESSISGSDSRRSASSPTGPSNQSSHRASSGPLGTIQGIDARKGGDGDAGHLGVDMAEGERQGSSRRHRARKSSDFLLDSGPSSIGRSPHYEKSRSRNVDGGGKGKRRNDELTVGKHRLAHQHHRQGLSLGSSPLAVAMTSASAADESPHSDTNGPRHTSGAPSSNAPDDDSPTHYNPPLSVGFDTDPAQIVNLALNLSESRRRHLPGRLPSRTMSGGRRRTTTGQAVTALGDRLHPHLEGEGVEDQGFSSSLSSTPENAKRSGTSSPHVPGSFLPRLSPSSDGTRSYMDTKDKHVSFELSKATFARAEKARQHFELLYEYLRLLPNLPPLRRPTNKSGAASSQSNSGPQARVYNPLQYIRNRKMRFREKCPIDTELGGWHNVENVHSWVNSVAELKRQSSDDPDEYFRLPPIHVNDQDELNTDERMEEFEIGSASSSLRRNNGANNTKPRRPRMDWIIKPPDLLADAAWLEEGANKTKIEDRDGNKIYPGSIEFKKTGWLDMNQALETRDEEAQPIELGPREDLPSIGASPSRDTKSIDRGRRKHKISRSIQLSHSRSSSAQISKSKWRRALSRSSSSSSASNPDSPQERRKAGVHMDGIDTALLEKQMMNLQEQGLRSGQDDLQYSKPRNVVNGKLQSPESRLKEPIGQPKLPNLVTDLARKRPVSVPPEGMSPNSPTPGTRNKDRMGRMSLEDMDSTAPNSPSNSGFFPKITINLSPPPSRSSSPTKKSLQRMIGARHDRSNTKQRYERDSTELSRNNTTATPDFAYTKSEADSAPEPYDLNDNNAGPKTHSNSEESTAEGLQRTDSASIKGYRPTGQQESRLRGIFKGGRIAEIVGNEVSRVGDFIWKKDAPTASRRSSVASSLASDHSDVEDEKASGSSKGRPIAYLRRLPTFSDDGGRLSRKNTDQDSLKYNLPNLPDFTSFLKQEDDTRERGTSSHPASSLDQSIDRKPAVDDGGRPTPEESAKPPKINVRSVSPFTPDTMQDIKGSPATSKGTHGFGPPPTFAPDHIKTSKDRDWVHDFTPAKFGSNQPIPMVTGLASLDMSAEPSRGRRPTLSKATREWSISSRSITTTSDTSLADKREIARVRALLLSSGIKAHEIARRAAEIRDPPPDFLLKSRGNPKDPVPRVTRAEEFVYAARNIDYRLKRAMPAFQRSMYGFSNSTCRSIKSELDRLENTLTQSLTYRTRAAASAAEDLSTELTTTNTLAVKQLNDALDKGIRKRNRRLRWLRRVGFVILEWALVGIMWWVWLIVMIWKITRGVWRGTVSGIKWILWL